MPRPTDRNASKDNEKPDRRAKKSNGMGMYIPILLAVVIVCGVGLAVIVGNKPKDDKPSAANAAPKKDPFADVPAEAPPTKQGGSSKYNFVSKAPDGLTDNANWKDACKLAQAGEELFKLATEAKAAGDTATLNEKGREAREKLTSAVEMTAVWEEELLEKYGDGNVAVREIMKVRSGWIDKMRWLHKSAAL